MPEAWVPELAKGEVIDAKLEQFLRETLENYNNGFKLASPL